MTAELATWARTLAVLAAAWLIVKAAELAAVVRGRYWHRRLHGHIIDAYAIRRRYRSTARFDDTIRRAEDTWLRFQPPTSRGDLTK